MVRRVALVWVMCCSMILACSGDCASCHVNLDYENDKRHAPMTECKTCHTEEKMSKIEMGGCGQDCFACHSAQKLNTPELSGSHQQIKDCIACHTRLDEFNPNNLFKKPTQIPQGGWLFEIPIK